MGNHHGGRRRLAPQKAFLPSSASPPPSSSVPFLTKAFPHSLDFRPGLACLLVRGAPHRTPPQQLEFHLDDFPPELVEKIRACLPFSAYIRSSLVSKIWKAATFSPQMLKLCSEMHTPEPWLFVLSMKQCRTWSYAFDPAFFVWRRVSLSFLPSDSVYPTASARGLICFSAYADGGQVLSIANPLMGTSKELPRWIEHRIDAVVGMHVEGNASSYKIVAVGSYETEAVTEIYDSRTNQWRRAGRLPPDRRMAFARISFSNGLFYCLTAGPPEALLVYNVETENWHELPIVTPSSFAYGKLVEHRDKILLIGLSQRGEAFKSIRIWEFCEPGVDMREVERMPYGMFKEFWGKGSRPDSFQFVSSGDLLYFYSNRNPRLIVCDLTTKPVRWLWLPAIPPCVDWSDVYLYSFCICSGLKTLI